MKYDDAGWHYGGEYPADLAPERGATHIAMFLAWAIERDLVGEFHLEESKKELALLRKHKMTPTQFLIDCCDEKMTDEDFNKEGNAFAKAYYNTDKYLEDYAALFGDEVDNLYRVRPTWKNLERMKAVIDIRFKKWQAGRKKKKR